MHNFADKWNTEWRVNLNMNKYEFLKHGCVAGIKVAHTQLIWTLQHSQIVFKILKFISRRCVKFWLCVIPSSLILLTVWASPHHPLKTNFNWILKTSPQLLSSFQARVSENVEQRLMLFKSIVKRRLQSLFSLSRSNVLMSLTGGHLHLQPTNFTTTDWQTDRQGWLIKLQLIWKWKFFAIPSLTSQRNESVWLD